MHALETEVESIVRILRRRVDSLESMDTVHRGQEWVISDESVWHWAECPTCKTMKDGIMVRRVQVRLYPPVSYVCRLCVKEWHRYERKSYQIETRSKGTPWYPRGTNPTRRLLGGGARRQEDLPPTTKDRHVRP